MKKPSYQIFLAIIPLLLLFGFLKREDTLEINVHDTYYIISYLHLAVAFSLIFSIYALGYWLIRNRRDKILKWFQILHVMITFLGPLAVFALSLLYKSDAMEYKFNTNLSIVVSGVIIFIFFAQLLFPLSLIYSLTRRKNNENDKQ